VVSSEVVEELSLELADLAGDHLVKESSDTGIDNADLLFTVKWLLKLERILRIASASKAQ
jgi:hypothetical protein